MSLPGAPLSRAGTCVARCTLGCLRRKVVLRGVVRAQPILRPTVSDLASTPPTNLGARPFRAPDPNHLWAADLRCGKTYPGRVYGAAVVAVAPSVVRPCPAAA